MPRTWRTRRPRDVVTLTASLAATALLAGPGGAAAAGLRASPLEGSAGPAPSGLVVVQAPASVAERLSAAPAPFAWARAAAARPRGLPRTWCGTPSLSDRPTLAAQRGLPTIHVIYAYTDDLAGRAGYFSTVLQSDISMIDAVIAERSGYRKTFRFDMGTDCGADYVDIQLLPLPGTRDDYLAGPTAQYPDDRWPAMAQPRLSDAVEAAIRLQTPLGTHDAGVPRRNFLVFIDGLNVDDQRQRDGTWRRTDFDWNWGAATMYADDRPDPANQQNSNDHGLIAEIYGASPDAFLTGFPVVDPSSGFGPAMTLHELLHTLGAVQPTAPHATNWLHCNDGADVMCYRDSTEARSTQLSVCALLPDALFPRIIDCNEDDYFSPAPPPGSYLDTHWNTFKSPFLASCAEQPAACGFQDNSTAADATTPLAVPPPPEPSDPAGDVLSNAATTGTTSGSAIEPTTEPTPIRLSIGCARHGQHVVTATARKAAGVRRVSFYADGRWAAMRTGPRFRIELPARTRTIRALSTDADGHRYTTKTIRLPAQRRAATTRRSA